MGCEEAVIEKNATACAMEWSIELEKALRSNNPGRCVEAILQIGKKLEQWCGESEATMAVYNIFGLVPGEDRLFANTIFLRLAVAFQLGTKHTRVSIVRIFLSLHRHCKGNNRHKQIKGILSKSRIYNHLELLKRVKIVFDTGDPESRALALVLFGCWSDFAKDSAQIRYVVLSSLISSNDLEVRASLFAAGCFSELTDDFASVVLEMLVNIVTSSETVSAVRLAAVRIFAKMGCSYTIANGAYKIGQKLVLDSTEEVFLVAMLVSLTKLAYRSTLLISEQVDFLLSLLNHQKALHLQATALRCLHFIFAKGMCQSLICASAIKAICSVVDKPELPLTMQCEALQLLHKIVLCTPTNLTCADIPEFAELLTIVDNASQSPIMSKSVTAIHVLVDIVVKIQRTEKGSDGVCTLPLSSQVVSLIMDRITSLVKPLLDLCQFNSIEVFKQVQSLLNLLLFLVGEYPDLGILVLDKVCLFIELLVNNMDSRQADSAVSDIVDFRKDREKTIGSKLLYMLNRFVLHCLESLNEAGTITNQIFDKVKLLVQCVHCHSLDCYTHMIYSLLLDSRIIWICMINSNEESGGVDGNFHTSLQNYLNKHELFTLEFAKRMLTKSETWPAYKAGIYAACLGAWFTAGFIFGQLSAKIQSDNCWCWLKSLSQLAHAERTLQVLLLPKHGSGFLDLLEMQEFVITFSEDDLCEIGQDAAGIINEHNHSKALVVAYRSLSSAGRTLETTFTSTKAFFFQRWFLALRAKVLEALIDVFRVLNTIPSGQNDISKDAQVGKSMMVESLELLQQITRVSFQLKRLSQEFDLIATSFIQMDRKSSNIIKALALGCSLLAFVAGFALYIPSLSAYENLTSGLDSSQNNAHVMLVLNLAGRLWNLDSDMSTNLCMLLEVIGQSKNCCHLLPKYQVLDSIYEVKLIVNICNSAIFGITCLQNETNNVHDEEILSKVARNGLQLLLNIIFQWICTPFRAPKFFFKVRPCFGSELFVSNADTRNRDGISVLTGFHLSLNLCLQLKNVPTNLPLRPAKFYCILYCSQNLVADRQNKEQMPWSSPPWESSDMVEMNEKLFQYVTECTRKTNHGKRQRDNGIDNRDGAVTAFVHFELDSRGQGFSNCLLDVSNFPVGCYRIKWHSCCIDSQCSYWSLLPLSAEPVFAIREHFVG